MQQLLQLDSVLRDAALKYAIIGGIAVNIHGFVRATQDLDLLMRGEDQDPVHEVLTTLGFAAIDKRPDIASYVRGNTRIDILFARRPISRKLLEQAVTADYRGASVPAISLEGLIGLKIQAFNDDQRRLRDVIDMIELFKINRGRLDLDEVRTYFRLFDHEALLDDILTAIG